MFKRKPHLEIKIIFLFAAIALVVLSFISYIRIQNLIAQSKFVHQTERVKLELNETFSILQKVESSQRGYILTKDSAFLPPIGAAKIKLTLHLDNIAYLTQDNPSQQQNISILKTAVFKSN